MSESPVPQETGLPKITVCPFMSCRATQFEYDRDPCQRAVCGMRDALAVPVSVEAGTDEQAHRMDAAARDYQAASLGPKSWPAPAVAQSLPSDSQAGQTGTDEDAPDAGHPTAGDIATVAAATRGGPRSTELIPEYADEDAYKEIAAGYLRRVPPDEEDRLYGAGEPSLIATWLWFRMTVDAAREYERTRTADATAPLRKDRSPMVMVDPAMRFGFPHIKGIPIDALVGMLSAGESMETVADDYDCTRADVLVACWYVGIYGLPECPRAWRKALRDWAIHAGQAMWSAKTCDYDAIPDPPVGADRA